MYHPLREFHPKLLTRISSVFLALLLTLPTQAQQDPQFTQNILNPFLFNPAAAGSVRGLEMFASARAQWVGLDGAPQSQYLSGHLPIYGLNAGAGLTLINDFAGSQRTTAVYGSFAYQVNLNKTDYIAFGVSGGLIQQALDGDELRAPDGNYNENDIDHNDNFIPIGTVQGNSVDFGAGIFARIGDLDLGLSTTHLVEPDVTYELGNGTTSTQFKRHYHVMASYKIGLTDKLDLQPGLQFRSDLVTYMIDATALILYQDNIWGGLAFRTYPSGEADAVAGMLGARISPRFGLGYSYDYTLSSLGNASSGSHEVLLSYRIAVEKPRVGKRINNLRYLNY
jgi:type IX secretion system PorP/SprF family membrane protein